jgi:hypothetical protein
MAIKYIEGLNKIDTSRGGSRNVVRELKKIRRDINIAAEEARQNEKTFQTKGSPYIQDREDYDPNIIHGSDKEDDWQNVTLSAYNDKRVALEEYKEKQAKVEAEFNRKKLNIIY